MIDLRFRNLPSAIEVDGEVFPINTDFRVWIAWLESLEVNQIAETAIFVDRVPEGDSWVTAAMAFARNENKTPHGGSTSTARSYDMVEDGEYIVGAFQQTYGIDLTDPSLKMHWHRFLALFRSIPGDTVLSQAMAYRTWSKGSKESYEQRMAKAKTAWTLPPKKTAESESIIAWQKEAFGKVTP